MIIHSHALRQRYGGVADKVGGVDRSNTDEEIQAGEDYLDLVDDTMDKATEIMGKAAGDILKNALEIITRSKTI